MRNTHVFLVQSTSPPVNDSLMELFLLVRCFRRASARTVTAIVPYYGYARQDRKTTARVPISASDVAMLLEAAGVDRMLSVDLHCGQIQGFFHHAPVDNLHAFVEHVPYIIKEIVPTYGDNPIAIVSPDAGALPRTSPSPQPSLAPSSLPYTFNRQSLTLKAQQPRAKGEMRMRNEVHRVGWCEAYEVHRVGWCMRCIGWDGVRRACDTAFAFGCRRCCSGQDVYGSHDFDEGTSPAPEP